MRIKVYQLDSDKDMRCIRFESYKNAQICQNV